MKKTFTACVLALGFAVVGADTAWAQVDTFMLVPGIAGDSTHERHQDWIEVLSLSQTLDATGKRRSSCDIQVVKELDLAGPLLWAAAVSGQVFPEVRVELVRAGETSSVLYEIKLGNVHVSTISTSSGGSSIVESLSLAAETATLTYFTQKPDGTAGPPVSATVSCK